MIEEGKGTRVKVSAEAHYRLRMLAAELTKRAEGRREFTLIDALDYAVRAAMVRMVGDPEPERPRQSSNGVVELVTRKEE